ncbi:MAG: hypothetical protein K0B15_08445 [Lentimicrobium sp.]|nr:hypothetical protein [Lentimicrobium sp.]
MIEKLPWDSDFFGYPVGRVILKDFTDKRLSEIKCYASDFRLVYLFADHEITDQPDFRLFDRKAFFEKPISDSRLDETIIEFDPGKHDYDKLLHLALLSGSYSRFRID